MKQIVNKRKDIVFYIELFPLSMHKDAYWKSKSIICSKNSIKLLEDCYEGKKIAKTECATAEVDETMKLAGSLGINVTPSIILPDGRWRSGALPESELLDLIDSKK